MSLSKVIEIARGELGNCEEPSGSNIQKYGAAYGLNAAPWCVIFLWYCFQHAGERMAFFGGGKTASCSMLLRWYKEQGLMYSASEVQKGDIVLLNFNGKGTPDHCGLVELVNYADSRKNMCVWTIEGNTTPGYEGSQDNGGCVANKVRFGDQIVAVCRPQYQPEEPVTTDTKPDYIDHWAERSIRKAIYKGVMKGYPDGSFRPNNNVTRAELAEMLDRLGLLEM